MASEIAYADVASLRGSCWASPREGFLACLRPSVAMRLPRLRPKSSEGVPSGGFMHAMEHVPRIEWEERGRYTHG